VPISLDKEYSICMEATPMVRLVQIALLLISLVPLAGCASTHGYPLGRDDPYSIQRADRFERDPGSSLGSFLLGAYN
jgi:hypothetical protein